MEFCIFNAKTILTVIQSSRYHCNKSRQCAINHYTREKSILKDVVQVLEVFFEVTEKISGNTYVTISQILSYVDYIYSFLENIKPITDIGKQFKNIVIQQTKSRLNTTEQQYIVAVSTLLHPRYNKVQFY